MRKLVLALLLLTGLPAVAQNLKVQVGFNIGMSTLYHDTRFETTPLHDLYSFVEISHRPAKYPWERFLKDYKIRTSFVQPRFGVSAHFTYKDWPVLLTVEAMSSPSSYQKMAYSATLGLGQELHSDDGYFFSFLGGYKFTKDMGFGAMTIVNSIGNDEAREYASTFFNPEAPLGTNTGHLFTLRGGLGKELGEAKIIRIGVEAFGELDLTPKTQRQSSMSNWGAQFFVRFKL